MLANLASVVWPLYPPRSARPGWIAAVLALIALIGWIDYATGYHINLLVVYLVPIFLATWMIGRPAGLLTAGLAVATWSALFLPQHQIYPLVFAWKALVEFLVYIVFVFVLDRLKTALSHADERFAAVLEGLDAMVYVFRPGDGRVLYTNHKCREAFGGAPRYVHEIEGRFGARFSGGEAARLKSQPWPLELQDAVTGGWLWLEAQSIRWVDGRAVELHIATDVTARKQAEEALRQQREKIELSQRLVTAGEMASLLAHELNQPLAAIGNYNTGCVNRLRSGNWQAREILEALEKSVAQARRAGSILQRVREFLRKREPDLAPCELPAAVAEACSIAGPEAKRRGVSLRLSVERDLPAAHADAVLVKQVVLNIIRNGIESMQGTPPARRELSVRVAADSADFLRVDIADNGCGLPAQLVPDPVKPFFTTKPDGMGMGLQICRSILDMHGGRLWATPHAQGGTVFHLTIPAVGS
jgi:signal transduction histidine kinase